MSPETPAQNQPLVSVICRSIGRPELQQALQSVTRQTYPNLEIVLVDSLASGLESAVAWCGETALVRVTAGTQYTRTQAANAGLDAARGTYLMFLDDDDWIAESHVSNLVTWLEAHPDVRAAYSSTRKTAADGTPLDYLFDTDYDPILLLRDNYIPIHAMLFHRSLLTQQCRFDESFAIYEDWDFWLQLQQHTPFHHVDAVTAFYREGGDSETAATDTRSRYNTESLLGSSRAALFNKWLPQWTGQQLNQLLGSLDKSSELAELAEALHQARLELDAAIRERHEVVAANSQLQDQLQHAALQLQDKDAHIANLTEHTENLERHSRELTAALTDIHQSLSWKLMGPFRRLSRALRGSTKPDNR